MTNVHSSLAISSHSLLLMELIVIKGRNMNQHDSAINNNKKGSNT